MYGQQLGSDAGVLAGDGVNLTQNAQSAERKIGGIADGCRDQIESR